MLRERRCEIAIRETDTTKETRRRSEMDNNPLAGHDTAPSADSLATAHVVGRSSQMKQWLSERTRLFRPSQFWEHLSTEDHKTIGKWGVENFKRFLPQHYFNWPVDHPAHPQFAALLRSWMDTPTLTPVCVRRRGSAELILVPAKLNQPPVKWLTTPATQDVYTFFVGLLWAHATRVDPDNLASLLSEPTLGNPAPTYLEDRLISQDLANSLREFRRIQPYLSGGSSATLAELGAGYGRLGYLAITACSCRYWVIDIPPALALSEWYLSTLFPDRRIFCWRPFTAWSDVEHEIARADIAFFTTDQLELFPENAVDAFASISTIHEMTHDQIEVYMALQFRSTSRAIYTKNWTKWFNDFDQTSFESNNLRAPQGWLTILNTADDVISDFTELLFISNRD